MKHSVVVVMASLVCMLASCSEKKDLGEVKEVRIIPQPQSVEEMGFNTEILGTSTIYLNEKNVELLGVARYLKNRIESSLLDANIEIKKGLGKTGIQLMLNKEADDSIGAEGYRLSSGKSVRISANTSAGIFNGVQTLFQLLPAQIYGSSPVDFDLILPAVHIVDQPRYAYRGMHLDPCRHFFSVEFTKKYLDYMAYHKLNKFHWHLTEDQGWRIEIKKYPKLVSVGSKRKGTLILNHEVNWKEQRYDTIPVEGYYSQDEIREIVQYAAERFIEVIPEIEMPGHATAALASYPSLSCTGEQLEVLQRPGIIKDVYCAGNDSVFTFLKDIIDEVTELFPSKYIHIGGDECPKDRWMECAKCQQRIKDHELADEKELQSWFISQMESHINSKGKTLIGWSEIMEGGIAPNAVLQSWIGTSAGVEAARQKHQAIMSPYQYLYFDGIYVDRAHRQMEPFGQTYCWTNTEKVYSFNPTPDTIPEAYHPYFIGAEATMWTEFIKTEKHLEYMLLPRLSALAEICWTEEEHKDLDNFKQRLDRQYARYDELGVNYRIPHPEASDTIRIKKGEKVTLSNPTGITQIRYTVDGTGPDSTSPIYTQPIEVHESLSLQARSFLENGRASSTKTVVVIIEP